MKAEHRRELHTNLLADRMGRLVQGMKSSPRSTSVLIWVFAVLTMGTYLTWQLCASAVGSSYSDLWRKVDAAGHQDPTQGVAELNQIDLDAATTLPGRTARFALARWLFQQGQDRVLGMDRAQAAEPIRRAREIYEELVGLPINGRARPDQCADSPLLAQEALMGIAKAHEALAGITTPNDPKQDLEQAQAAYRRLADQYPNSVLGKAAAERADELEKSLDQVAKFYEELKPAAGPKLPPPPPSPLPEAKGP